MAFPKRTLLLDLETTGLNREHDQIISIGITYLCERNSLTTDFWFLHHPDEEKKQLSIFLQFIENYEMILSYNGKGFEFPFLLARLEHYGLDTSLFLRLKLIDLKNTLRNFEKNRLALEKCFSYQRQCQSTGYDVVKLYRTYVLSQQEIYKTCILEHQKEEMKSLYFFWELYHVLYHVDDWQILQQDFSEDHLQLTIQQKEAFTSSFCGVAFRMTFSYEANDTLLHLSIPLFKGVLCHALEPLKDYYYIESQKQLLHKSLAQFIPANLKRKATKEECVVRKESTFLPLASPYKLSASVWYHTPAERYIEACDFSSELLSNQLFYHFFQKTPSQALTK